MDTICKKEITKMVGIANLAYFGIFLSGNFIIFAAKYYVLLMASLFNWLPEVRDRLDKLQETYPEIEMNNLTDEELLEAIRITLFDFLINVDLPTVAGIFVFVQLCLNLWFTKGIDQSNPKYSGIWLFSNSGVFSPFGILGAFRLFPVPDLLPKVPFIDNSFLYTHVTFIGISLAIVYALRDCWNRGAAAPPIMLPMAFGFGQVLRSCRKG